MKRVLILGTVFPESNSSAAGRKMLQWISLFQQQKWLIHYASTSPLNDFSDDLSKLEVETQQVEVNAASFDLFLQEIQPEIVLYDRFMVEEQFSWRIREAFPNCVHLLETQDLHFLRWARQKDESIYNQLTKRELAAILRCDLSFIISRKEITLLQEKFPFVAPQIEYFPLCYSPDFSAIENLSDRRDFFFIGNFHHAPNVDAVLFLKKIWKQIHTELKTVNCHIYGAYPTQQILELQQKNDGFFVHGHLAEAKTAFLRHRVLLAPLKFGAGLKGKLLESMQFGGISLTTEIGAEGISEKPFWNGKIVSQDEFATAAIQLYLDREKDEIYQKNGFKILQENFDLSIFNALIINKINNILLNIEQWRNERFLTEIVNFHRIQSVRYLSKWINEKQNVNKK